MDDQEEGEIPSSPDLLNNYDVVDMEIDSSDDSETVDDEAQRLRQILLDQIAKSRTKAKTKPAQLKTTPKKTTNVPETPKSPPSSSTTSASTSTETSTLPSTPKAPQSNACPSLLPPPLSPPNFNINVLPPPPNPPNFASKTVVYADESYNPAGQLEDTPRSPDHLLALSHLVQSDDDSLSEDDEIENELDLEEAKRESRDRRKEIDRLLRRQRLNDEECRELRKEIETTKRELLTMELRLEDLMEISINLNARIQSHFEKQLNHDAKNVSRLGQERLALRSKFATKKARRRLELRNLKRQVRKAIAAEQQAATRTLKSPLAPSTIDTNIPQPPQMPSPNISPLKIRIRTQNSNLNRLKRKINALSVSGGSVLNKSPAKEATQTEAPSNTSAQELNLNVQHIIGNGKSNQEAEQDLRHRLMTRTRRRKSKETSKEKKTTKITLKNRAKERAAMLESENRAQTESSSKEAIPAEQQKQEEELNESLNKICSFGLSLPARSTFGSLEEAVRNPLIGIKAYRLFPSYPFEYIEHPALTNRLIIDKPLCPFELHGICADPTCEWQHDRDIRVPPEDIIKDLLELCPSVCPPTVDKDKLARKLLEMNSVDYVARLLSATVSEDQRNAAFAQEIQNGLIQGS